MIKIFFSLCFSILLFASLATAQTTQVTISFNEQFFDALLDAVFKNLKQPDFPLAGNGSKFKVEDLRAKAEILSFQDTKQTIQNPKPKTQNCNQVLRLEREQGGTRTAVRFREGKIYAPIAFSGSYNPPFIGCVDFRGVAETNIELEFDKNKEVLIGRIKVLNVQLSNAPNLMSGVLAKFVQSSIDKKINPIEILRADKFSFIIPIQNAGGALRLRATNLRHEIGEGVLNVHVEFEFLKAD